MVQVLKKSVKDNIIQSAKAEFLKHGYNKASMRQISSNCGITVGNMYRYFKNKEVLFSEIIEPAYQEVLHIIKEFNNYPIDQLSEAHDLHNLATQRILDVYYKYSDELLILINGCDGTDFEKTVEELIDTMKDLLVTTTNSIKVLRPDIQCPSDFLMRIIAKGYLDGITYILSAGLKKMELEEEIKTFNKFQFQNYATRFREE